MNERKELDGAGVAVEQCDHGVRYPHPCDDCLNEDIPQGMRLADHPCYGLSFVAPTDFSHRAYLPKDGPIYCERCGTELDRNKGQKTGAPLSWQPRLSATTPPEPGIVVPNECTFDEMVEAAQEGLLLEKAGIRPEPEPVDEDKGLVERLRKYCGGVGQEAADRIEALSRSIAAEPVDELEAMALAIAKRRNPGLYDGTPAEMHRAASPHIVEHSQRVEMDIAREDAKAALTAQRGLTLAKEGVGEDALREALQEIRDLEPGEFWGFPDRYTGDRTSHEILWPDDVFGIIDKALAGDKTEGGA